MTTSGSALLGQTLTNTALTGSTYNIDGGEQLIPAQS